MKPRTKPPDPPKDDEEPSEYPGLLQLYRIKVNDIDYLLFGPPLTLKPETLTANIQNFQVGELIPAETLLRSLRLIARRETEERNREWMQ
jgi:hypothetical protein